MAGDHGLSDLRFVGYDNNGLAEQVDGLRNGQGPGTLNEAVLALIALSDGLADTDDALRKQLAAIGVSWQGEAADGGTAATENASIYTNAARQQAIDAMNNYQSNSSDSLNKSQALPVPPGMTLNAQPVDSSTHISSVSGFNGGGGGFNPGGLAPGGGSGAGFPGAGG